MATTTVDHLEEKDESKEEDEEVILKYEYDRTEFHLTWIADTADFFHKEKLDEDVFLSMVGQEDNMEPEEFAEFLEELQKDEVVETLDLTGFKLVDLNDLGIDGTGNNERLSSVFDAILKGTGPLVNINLSSNHFGLHSWRLLSVLSDFLTLTKIEALDLTGCTLMTPGRRVYNGILLLAEAFRQMPRLKRLRLTDNGLDVECFKAITHKLLERALDPESVQVEALDLSQNPLLQDLHGSRTDGAWGPFCHALRHWRALAFLNVSDLEADYLICQELLASLPELINLETFICERNELHIVGAKEIARQLDSNKCIRYLRIAGSQIEDEGAIAILEALKQNETLQYLDISDNGLTVEIKASVERVALDSISIMDICFAGNEISSEDVEEFTTLIHANHQFNQLRQSPENFDITAVTGAVYSNIVHKLDRLTRAEMKGLQHNPLFEENEDLRSRLLLLCPPTRDELVQQAMERKKLLLANG
mmetsp:Transcript_23873/g.35859  ORF Transcript_23873/g.35859 Transcript_23873/m.35859 type:complete len:479 (-) Transcript_23873:156-1592(-)